MVVIGAISGATACHKVREEEWKQRHQEEGQKWELRLIRREKDQLLTKIWNSEDEEAYEGLGAVHISRDTK